MKWSDGGCQSLELGLELVYFRSLGGFEGFLLGLSIRDGSFGLLGFCVPEFEGLYWSAEIRNGSQFQKLTFLWASFSAARSATARSRCSTRVLVSSFENLISSASRFARLYGLAGNNSGV